MPQLFLDTANIDDIETLMPWGIFSGITTNPLIFREVNDVEPISYYQKLAEKYPIPLSIQLLEGNVETLIEQGKSFASLGSNVVIKVPMFEDGRGIAVLSELTKQGIKVNVTALMNTEQTLLCLLTSPSPAYVSLFFNRIRDGGGDPHKEITNTRELIEKIGSDAKIIVGSIRTGNDVREAIMAGAHIVTVSPKVLFAMAEHPKSIEFISQSQQAWQDVIKNRQDYIIGDEKQILSIKKTGKKISVI